MSSKHSQIKKVLISVPKELLKCSAHATGAFQNTLVGIHDSLARFCLENHALVHADPPNTKIKR